jgi:hypothetical protein
MEIRPFSCALLRILWPKDDSNMGGNSVRTVTFSIGV